MFLEGKAVGIKVRQSDHGCLAGRLAQFCVSQHLKVRTHLAFPVTMALYCSSPELLSLTQPLPPCMDGGRFLQGT